MDHRTFDSLVQSFAVRRSRRSAIKGGAVAAAGVVFGQAAAGAQGTPMPDEVAEQGFTLFVQTAAGGTFLPNTLTSPEPGVHGDYLLTLSGHPGQTIAFADRPARDFGQIETGTFLSELGFLPANPPNAAIVASTPDGVDDVLVVELFNPIYDDEADLLIYEATILGEYMGESLAPAADRQEDDQLPTEFGHVSLFIDDCPDVSECLFLEDGRFYSYAGQIPNGPYGQCWSWDDFACLPCDRSVSRDSLRQRCNSTYQICEGNCEIT